MKKRLPFAALLLSLCLGLTSHADVPAKTAPNILLILADDLGYADLSVQGCTDFKTPNIDRIAQNGIRFTQGYVSNSVCSPSRAGLLTGRIGIGFEANLPEGPHGLDTSLETMADMLKKAGYGTSCIGKWHLGYDKQFYPTNRGFDYFCGLRSGSRSYFYDKKTDKPGSTKAIEINGKQVKFEGYVTDYFTDKAIEVIKAHRKKQAEKPFFMYLSYTAPHGPMHGKPEYIDQFKHIKNEKRRIYAAMVKSLDEGVGRVLQYLEDNGLGENTIVVFLSDNGGPTPDNASSNRPLKGHKGSLDEGGIRVPFLIQWPARFPAGQVRDDVISSLDLLPTFASAARAQVVEKANGIDLLPYLSTTDRSVGVRSLIWRRGEMTNLALRSGDFKWILKRDSNETALYNLKDDISEKHNLATKHPKVVQDLSAEHQKWEAEAPPPSFKGTWEPKK